MKKLILLFSIFGIFMLVGCNVGTDNTPSSSEPTNNTDDSTPNDQTETGVDVYDDDLPWGPLH